jgi:RsiW-degrading membrane proteinase PrsW (M82 family)
MGDCDFSVSPIKKHNHIIYPEIMINDKVITGKLSYDFPAALDTYNLAKNKFESIVGHDLIDKLKNQSIDIIIKGSDATIEVFYILLGGITITIFLLMLIFFVALYYNDPTMISKLAFLALLILFLSVIIMYMWIQSIYKKTSIIIYKDIEKLQDINKDVQNAIIPILCSVSGFD